MTKKQQEFGRLVWTGLRQMQALRDAVTWSLGGHVTIKRGRSDTEDVLTKTSAAHWLEDQGLPPIQDNNVGLSLVGLIGAAIEQRRMELLGPDDLRAIKHGQRARHQEVKDFGTERSGAGWADAANFCITSAFLRLLGAWEQFEVDTLKSLYYYRPSGESPGPEAEKMLIEPELEVVYEEPVADPKNPDKLNYSFPPEWSDVKKDAWNNIKRNMIFSRQYDIVTIHGAPDEQQLKANRKRRDAWYDSRNPIAHGRKQVTMTLAEYVEVEVFVYRAMTHVANQCLEKHGLLV